MYKFGDWPSTNFLQKFWRSLQDKIHCSKTASAASFFFIHFLYILYMEFIVNSKFEEGQILGMKKSAQQLPYR